MRSGDGVAFQHQQFQEWYASRRVAELMKAAANGDAGARVELRASVLDRPSWEESVLFAAERLSRESNGAEVVAHAVRLALPIDPMLAAEMIFRAAPAFLGSRTRRYHHVRHALAPAGQSRSCRSLYDHDRPT
jgi:hypothetical protein